MTRRAQPTAQRCAVAGCEANAPYGFGPPLRPDRIWLCAAHKGRGAPRKAGAPGARRGGERPAADLGGDLFGGA